MGELVGSIHAIAGYEGTENARLRGSWGAAEARCCVAGLVSMQKAPEDHRTSAKENCWHRLKPLTSDRIYVYMGGRAGGAALLRLPELG